MININAASKKIVNSDFHTEVTVQKIRINVRQNFVVFVHETSFNYLKVGGNNLFFFIIYFFFII
jgi:hypothetical protein